MTHKLPTPKMSDLRAIHKNIANTLDPVARLSHTRELCRWYTGYGITKGGVVINNKDYKKAMSMSELGLRSDTPVHEADNSLGFAMKYFEKVIQIPGAPTYAETMTALELNRPTLEAKAAADRNKVAPFLDAVNQVFNEVGITYEVRTQEKDRIVGIDKIIRVSMTYAMNRTRDVRRNLTTLVFEELPAVLRALSIRPREDNGQLAIDTSVLNQQLPEVTAKIGAVLYQGVRVAAPVAGPPVVRAPRTVQAPLGAAVPGGLLFRAGTLTSTIYQRLLDLCGQGNTCNTTITEMTKDLNSGDPNALINDVVTKGRKTGAFSLQKSKSGDLVFTKA